MSGHLLGAEIPSSYDLVKGLTLKKTNKPKRQMAQLTSIGEYSHSKSQTCFYTQSSIMCPQ